MAEEILDQPAVYTIEEYLRGLVPVSISDAAIRVALQDAGVYPDSALDTLTTKQKELCMAGVYVWCSTLPTSTGKVEDKHGVWSHSEGGYTIGSADRTRWLRLANAIYRKYGLLDKISSSGVRVHNMGIRPWG